MRIVINLKQLNKEELMNALGWVSNNLALILSNEYTTNRTAIEIALETMKIWKNIEDNIGLGACYFVLGVTYYRSERFEDALVAFQQALNIFEPLYHSDWLGQIYSWRGALYCAMQQPDKAMNDLQRSLEIGPFHLRAMTLSRLGRLHMSTHEWKSARSDMEESLELAKKIPDFVYWIGAIARLAAISAETGEFQRLNEYQSMLEEALSVIPVCDPSSLGIAYISLAKLALGQKNKDLEDVLIDYLKKGITLLTENGPYISTDVVKRLAVIERGFDMWQISPETIQILGKALEKYVIKKESENILYGSLIPIINRWANWHKEK